MHIDLDPRLETARDEAKGEPNTLAFRGHTFTMSRHLDVVGFGDAFLREGVERMARLLRALLGTEQYEQLLALGPIDDATAGKLLEAAAELYGLTVGESEASGDSSQNGSVRSRRTSNGSTR